MTAAAERHDLLPQRDDVLRRSRAEAVGRKVLSLSESPGISLRRPCRKPARADREIPDGAPQQRHGVSAGRGERGTIPPDDRMTELHQLFFETPGELVQNLNDQAMRLEKTPGDVETARSLRRTVHTLKGDAAACGFRELSELSHEFEDVLTLENTAAAASGPRNAFA